MEKNKFRVKLPSDLKIVKSPEIKEGLLSEEIQSLTLKVLGLAKSKYEEEKKKEESCDTEGRISKKKGLESGLSIEDSSYVESNPGEKLADLRRKNSALILPEKKKVELTEKLALGAEKADYSRKLGKKSMKKIKKIEREKTKGKDWFDMKAPEMTEDIERDLEVLQMRGALDTKRFYKNEGQAKPKIFHIAKEESSAADYYTNRVTKKERKKTLVDELMADAEFKKKTKRKYAEILEKKEKANPHKYGKKMKQKGKGK